MSGSRVRAVVFEVNLLKYIMHSNYLTMLRNFIISHDFVSTCHKAGQSYHLKILHPKPKMGSDFSSWKLKTPLFHWAWGEGSSRDGSSLLYGRWNKITKAWHHTIIKMRLAFSSSKYAILILHLDDNLMLDSPTRN